MLVRNAAMFIDSGAKDGTPQKPRKVHSLHESRAKSRPLQDIPEVIVAPSFVHLSPHLLGCLGVFLDDRAGPVILEAGTAQVSLGRLRRDRRRHEPRERAEPQSGKVKDRLGDGFGDGRRPADLPYVQNLVERVLDRAREAAKLTDDAIKVKERCVAPLEENVRMSALPRRRTGRDKRRTISLVAASCR